MSITINYKGRFGNNVFQYVTARIFCEKNNINLTQNFNFEILKTTETKKYENGEITNVKILNSYSFIEDELLGVNNTHYIFDDFFQNCVYINKNIDLINSFFELPKFVKNCSDIVLHIRLDDFIHTPNLENPTDWSNSEIIHPNYYKSILDKEVFDKVYIVTQPIKYDWEKKYLKFFNKYQPIIFTKTPEEDFNFMRSFNKIITSNSTFAFWSAFLSDAEKIYTFKKSGFFGRNLKCHGEHVKELWNIKNKSTPVDGDFYFGI